MTVELALDLAEYGFTVFPVLHSQDNEKKPLTQHGHKDASRDPGVILDWWEKWPSAKVGVPAGPNNLNILDVDQKNGKDGFTSLDEAWVPIPETFGYDTSTGGRHLVYSAPEGKQLNGQSNYRGMEGVDRRAGESWVLWVGPVPDSPIAPAPEWLCDETTERDLSQFEGEIQDWYGTLTLGEPNALVRKAMQRAQERFTELGDDFSHSDMVELQFELVRLGAEGNRGVPEGLDFLEELFLARTGSHTRQESEWGYEWTEALQSAVAKYGDLTALVQNLPEYNMGLVPSAIPDTLFTQTADKAGFSKLLGSLIKETDDDNRIASILWNCSATEAISKDWGLEFVYKRIAEARVRPEPVRENPRIEAAREQEVVQGRKSDDLSLLTSEERSYLLTRPTYVDEVQQVAIDMGYDQLGYFRSVAWVTAAMAFSFKGFIPLSKSHNMGVNLWFICPGESGTGKSVTSFFRDGILKVVFEGDPKDIVPFDLGDDSSPQGLHLALLERDRMASLFSSDEAAGFFSTLGLRDWKTGIDEKITSWYNGPVSASNKMTLKEFRGKSAITSFNMHMFGTPDKLTKVITSEMFGTGFMARVNWVMGNPPRDDSSRFQLDIDTSDEIGDFDETPEELVSLAMSLVGAMGASPKPTPMKPAKGVMKRLSEAYEQMYRMAEKRENFDLVEPSLTRLAETLMKCAAITAMYRGDSTIEMDDALHAIRAGEEFYQNLFRVTAMVSAGDFQRQADEIEMWLRQVGGRASKAKIVHRFRNFIQKSPRELDELLTFLTESGIINREEEGSKVMYAVNG